MTKPALAADGVFPAMWRVCCEIAGLGGFAAGPAEGALDQPESADLLLLGDLTSDRLDMALASGFRFGAEATVAPFWLGRVLQFRANARALMGWALAADSYRESALHKAFVNQLRPEQGLSAERCFDLDLMLTESIVNTLDHGAPPAGAHLPSAFGLFISAHEEGLEVAVHQMGDGPADPDGLLGRQPASVPDLDAERGRGLFLISGMARFAWFEDEGRSLHFVVSRQ
jgi:anti-sigma regulatory factor (Ser/Thr protein kinase)